MKNETFEDWFFKFITTTIIMIVVLIVLVYLDLSK